MSLSLQSGLRWLALSACVLALIGCGQPTEASKPEASAKNKKAAQPTEEISNPTAASTEKLVPLASFSTNINDGVDPFFPDSDRRLPKTSQAKTEESRRKVKPLSDFLRLTGLWGSSSQPLALINRTPFAPGEEARVTVVVPDDQKKVSESHKLVVRCLEVRQDSVLIMVEGEQGTKELSMRSRL